MPVSRPTNTIVDTPSLEPSHTIAGNDSTTPKHPPSVQYRPSQFGHPQVPDNRERPYRSSPAFCNESEEAKELNSPAASEDSSDQMVLSTPSGKFEHTPQSGNRGHRAITLKYRASLTAINGDNHHTDPDISELIPLAQMESNERENSSDWQGSRRASKGISVEHRRNDQHMSQEGSLSRGGSPDQPSSKNTPADLYPSRLSPETPKGVPNQQSISTGITNCNVAQQTMRPNVQNTAQPQARDDSQATLQIQTLNHPIHTRQIPNLEFLKLAVCQGVPTQAVGPYSLLVLPRSSDMKSEAVGPISTSSPFLSNPTSLPHYPLHELQGHSTERYWGPPLPSLSQQMSHHAGEL
ncbi:uncharacterized protein N7511_000812 [Penicillium nucicola]|uniref:uncharacterized protein n=1 Tax=Penicillium nucicola TaxID=1850975 RepID=UPI002544F489|nr:uncharacterized protein N7511_000812 [Penicillium nucicola]KAJ5775801.1 hypothetical protein N7511_000812 [Penicillium nucicola]